MTSPKNTVPANGRPRDQLHRFFFFGRSAKKGHIDMLHVKWENHQGSTDKSRTDVFLMFYRRFSVAVQVVFSGNWPATSDFRG